MRYRCHLCGKSVTSELPDDSVIRALLVCPECIEARRIRFAGDDRAADPEVSKMADQITERARQIKAERERKPPRKPR